MTNNEKIQRAEQLIAEANALLNEVKDNSSNEEDVIAKYKNDYNNKGKQYYLNSYSNVDFIIMCESFERIEELTQSPYQLYLKTLYEFFKEEINADKENFETLLPEGYMRLQYQIDAVTQARQKLDAYNGVFISDVVGLGKTYICAMLANTFNRNTYKLFVCFAE